MDLAAAEPSFILLVLEAAERELLERGLRVALAHGSIPVVMLRLAVAGLLRWGLPRQGRAVLAATAALGCSIISTTTHTTMVVAAVAACTVAPPETVELAAVAVALVARVTLPAEDRPKMLGPLETPVPALVALVARTQVAAVAALVQVPLPGQGAVVL